MKKVTFRVFAAGFLAAMFSLTGCEELLKNDPDPEAETISKPAVSPAPGEYETAPTITLVCATEGAVMYYTTDADLGIDDLLNGTPYTAPFTLTPFPATLRAIAVKNGTISGVLTAEYTKSDVQTPVPTFGSGVYVAGWYNYTTTEGYTSGSGGVWKDGAWYSLAPQGTARAVTVSDGDVYIAGNWNEVQDEQYTRHTGYWKDGTWTELAEPTGASFVLIEDIAVSGSTVCAAGYYSDSENNFHAGYWLNGTWHNLSEKPGSVNTYALCIAVSGSNVYVGGYSIDNSEKNHPCYWLNGVRTDLPLPAGANPEYTYVEDIAVSGGNIYVAGRYFSSSSMYIGYWLNGTWHQEGIDNNGAWGIWLNALVVSGSTVYLAGGDGNDNACYWINGTKHDLAAPAGASRSRATALTLSGGTVYVAGYYEDNAGKGYPCYWKNGVLQVLNEPAGAVDNIVRGIAVVP